MMRRLRKRLTTWTTQLSIGIIRCISKEWMDPVVLKECVLMESLTTKDWKGCAFCRCGHLWRRWRLARYSRRIDFQFHEHFIVTFVIRCSAFTCSRVFGKLRPRLVRVRALVLTKFRKHRHSNSQTATNVKVKIEMAATNTSQLTFDLSGLGGAISATIKQSLNAIQSSLNSLANKPAAAPYDIAGLRELIIGRCTGMASTS